ncbi:unnamed protein product [Mycena citricolor]|uniref:Helicase C-terminal domain-containing protein n=1 Tax=Mycena citricolor TaxID=2018698 RepID=A0AAD2K6B2_9AGAR|nr:unnamed protein product [Mycena citricolor]
MPSFLPLKRKHEETHESSRKRPAIDTGSHYWMVQWRNFQAKKHKTWDGDGVLVVDENKTTLYDSEGKVLGNGKRDPPYTQGRNLSISGKDVELDRSITRQEFISGTCFGDSAALTSTLPTSTKTAAKQFRPLTLNTPQRVNHPGVVSLQPVDLLSTSVTPEKVRDVPVKLEAPQDSFWTANWRKPNQNKKHKTWDGDAFVSQTGGKLTMVSEEGKVMGSTPWKGELLYGGYHLYIAGKEVELDCQVTQEDMPNVGGGITTDDTPSVPEIVKEAEDKSLSSPASVKPKFIAPQSFYGPAPATKARPKGPLHDPGADGAIVFKAPSKDHATRFNPKNAPVVAVVLDPMLAPRLRPHQIEGIKFMYECVMGLRKHEGQGCILADEMGLGKTLQTISLIWTLLKQNPYADGFPAVGRVLVVCPVSLITVRVRALSRMVYEYLVQNWKNEFQKWLGRDRLGVVTCDKDKKVVKTFQNARTQHVLIIGYERLRTVIAELASCQAQADFCNPGLLENYQTFRRVYEMPILASRAPESSAKERELGEARMKQLLAVAKSFVLRREAILLQNYLPPKHEYVVFVTPTPLQLSIFSKILNPDKLDDLAQSSTAESLALINMLTKISSSPILLKATVDKHAASGSDSRTVVKRAGVQDAVDLLPQNCQIEDTSLSGKLTALAQLLKQIHDTTDEKCVLVSHYTSTLNILEAFCKAKRYSYHRLDGQTPALKRQEYVNTFNKSTQRSSFVFLLSSKAGGVGINLIGASRLCLVDSDWNPSHDLQSMARCHRDGQKRPVFIYRLLTAGTIDEKIYQRQVTKLGLSNCKSVPFIASGDSSKSDSFSRKDLRDIFRIHPNTICNTHDLLGCPCDGKGKSKAQDDGLDDDLAGDGSDAESDSDVESKGFVNASCIQPEDMTKMDRAYLEKKRAGLAALGQWKHINCLLPNIQQEIHDPVLRKLIFVPPRAADARSPLVAALNSMVTIGDLPGGSISFLFEKNSTADTV